MKSLAKKEAVYFCIVLLITKCMRAEIKGDEKLLIDLEGPNHCTTVNAAARCSFVTTLKTIVVLILVCQTLP